ncbi:MAG: hypothetical protein JNL79_38160 [Myxococcales bacterium]|nr:hypothetical protein [Myxococcales bacterium]
MKRPFVRLRLAAVVPLLVLVAIGTGCERKAPEATEQVPPVEPTSKPKVVAPKAIKVKEASEPPPPPTASVDTPTINAPKVVNVLHTPGAFWSPWKIPGLNELPIPASLPSVIPLPSVVPWPTNIALPTATVPTPPSPTAPSPTAAPVPGKKAPLVILYGTDYCAACKQGQAYMKSRGIAYTFKDVGDSAASTEMATKVKKAGQKEGAIPVTDVEGDLLVGWSDQSFDKLYDEKAK